MLNFSILSDSQLKKRINLYFKIMNVHAGRVTSASSHDAMLKACNDYHRNFQKYSACIDVFNQRNLKF